MTFSYIYAIRGIAGTSMVTALALMIICSFVFASRLEDLKSSKFPAFGVPTTISDNPKENDHYQNLLENLNTMWVKYRSVLVSSSTLAILSSLLQLIFSGLTAGGDSKIIRLYIRKWITVHFILIFVLFIVLLNTVILSENGKDKETWEKLIKDLKHHLDKERPANDYSGLYRFLDVGQPLIYIGVGIDLAMIFILMGAMLYFLRNHKDEYEQYD